MFEAVPDGCKRAADIGCGNGGLTRERHRRGISEIVGLDRDEPTVQRCRSHRDAADIRYIVGDLRRTGLTPKGSRLY
ncbi:hypothetical protein GCM10010172_67230 [Paractinoplanes ferrugineus]|uniref:Methyltransferase domain-containing protein n=1 Tax=Paractinoplanes ferrugineus TaxID=113564 RepID=A0A919J9L3_9ACTN|nr:class I SAM-dependent methyltransferase [Actinoplanes ferrugineus]GIE13116.1 hypothetical protein Afe05nite_49560 [Actinoplanes ferrugineus]